MLGIPSSEPRAQSSELLFPFEELFPFGTSLSRKAHTTERHLQRNQSFLASERLRKIDSSGTTRVKRCIRGCTRCTLFHGLMAFMENERKVNTVYPQRGSVFTAFRVTPLDKVKVVVIGQDPYHGPGQAHGLAFSVLKGQRIPPSLNNIYKELSTDLEGFRKPEHGCLLKWANQGVLLLNTILTVRKGEPGSHRDEGWEEFTTRAIREVNDLDRPVVFLLWGKHAQSKAMFVDSTKHTVLMAPHPSPMSARTGFFGCRHFSKANEALVASGQEPVDWTFSA